MGGKTGTSFTLTNYGSIFVDGTSASATKGMGVNPDGKAVNEGLIAVRKGSAMTDNSGSASKTLVNKNVISVEDAGGVGIFYRKENITSGEVTNLGDIHARNGGVGVAITSDKNEEAYHNKFFTNSGRIMADENSVAILVYDTDNATVSLEGNSRVDGLISLQGKNNNLMIDGVGSKRRGKSLRQGILRGRNQQSQQHQLHRQFPNFPGRLPHHRQHFRRHPRQYQPRPGPELARVRPLPRQR